MAQVTFLIGAADYVLADREAAELERILADRFVEGVGATSLDVIEASALRLAVDIRLHRTFGAGTEPIDLGQLEIALLADLLDAYRAEGADVAPVLYEALWRHLD
jgi:hypothetical protein